MARHLQGEVDHQQRIAIRSHAVDDKGKRLDIHVRQRVEVVSADPPQARHLDRWRHDAQARDPLQQFRAAAVRGGLAGGALVMRRCESFTE
ncbi:hypothetical protein B1806_09480 [Metallibacterium scheffleri]|uniref:Uncharacterized protein n=1 Tax=Metallibacterium scheffleri TaxID=993689 RepID=A0A4V3UTC6_9GAMM|nr:hypothetical protein B1806_09480 [Metallibacterium scheffleri]